MAFHWQTFRTRALTAIVFVAVMLTGLLWNHWSFFLLFSVIHFGCWWEYLALQEKIRKVAYHPYVKFGWMLLGYSIMIWFCKNHFFIGNYGLRKNLFIPLSAAGFILLIIGIFQSQKITLKSFGVAALGLLYISLSWGLMIHLYTNPFHITVDDNDFVVVGKFLPLVIIASIWINDTMAYIVGSFIGRRPLSSISPKKTWEGTIGGVVLCVGVTSGAFLFIKDTGASIAGLIAPVALIAAVIGTIGDLLESKLKRMAGVKDSGSIMPGHGGFLDRFDSLLLAVPFVSLYLLILTR